jgi:L-glyceraldehyde 3-phosphate reductase
MVYRRSGQSGLILPALSLGLWHNFGGVDSLENGRAMLRRAFDLGIHHFDLANNYGPPPGSAENTFGLIFDQDFRPYRDELILSSKAGYRMGPGPFGEWGSRKSLVSSCDQSLKRMKVDYVDVFYSHRPDPHTPLEETMGALDFIVRSGRALYAGISNYSPEQTREAARILKELGTPCTLHQPRYSMLDRRPEAGLIAALQDTGMGSIVFSPLEQGLLSDKYLNGIPTDSRAATPTGFLRPEHVTDDKLAKVRQLNTVALERGQSLAQMALCWVLRLPEVTSALIGSSRVSQIENAVQALEKLDFSAEELDTIEKILQG